MHIKRRMISLLEDDIRKQYKEKVFELVDFGIQFFFLF